MVQDSASLGWRLVLWNWGLRGVAPRVCALIRLSKRPLPGTHHLGFWDLGLGFKGSLQNRHTLHPLVRVSCFGAQALSGKLLRFIVVH